MKDRSDRELMAQGHEERSDTKGVGKVGEKDQPLPGKLRSSGYIWPFPVAATVHGVSLRTAV